MSEEVLTRRYPSNDLRNIIFEDINDKISRGKLSHLIVLIMRDNGYVNATKLCRESGKEFEEWYQSELAKEYVKLVGEDVGVSVESLRIEVEDGEEELRGTYVHPKLIVILAMWADVEYALFVGKIMSK